MCILRLRSVYRFPFAIKMQFASELSFVLYFKPLGKAPSVCKRCKFTLPLANLLEADNVIVTNIEINIVSQILNVDNNGLVNPDWVLALVFTDC